MIQKVLRVGSSAAVTIPKKSLKELGLKIGDSVIINANNRRKIVCIQPAENINSKKNAKIAKLTLDFIERYRKDLEILAKK